MNEYNFFNLSATEFENFVRDLLQAERNVIIESFSEGPDGGTDLRYTDNEGMLVVIQCKRIKNWSTLYNKLKAERAKVKRIHPSQYVVATSFNLSVSHIEKIQKLFGKYIVSTYDIIGHKTLNNLLQRHKKIEIIYYKLWITSTNVLEKIIHNRVYNQSKFAMDEIVETGRMFVPNDSFREALAVLSVNHFVIISGEPGIGKTTLAYMLAYYLLSSDYEEFVYLSKGMGDAYSLYNKEKKIIFLFDDFLGLNFLEDRLSINEDLRLQNFISGIRKSPNHLLIMTTREYILRQAQDSYERLSDRLFAEGKFILDLGKYTHVIKAEMLSNHLSFNDIPDSYISVLLKNRFYMQLVYHANFNPRLIEIILDKGVWETIPEEEFAGKFKSFLDNPEELWLKIFEHQISMFSRCGLAILATINSTIYVTDYEDAMNRFAELYKDKYGIKANSFEFGKSYRELQKTFIRIDKDVDNDMAIGFQNPSIRDFLLNYLSRPRNRSFLNDILQSAVFLDQLTSATERINKTENHDYSFRVAQKIRIDNKMLELLCNKVIQEYDTLKVAQLSQYTPNGKKEKKWYYRYKEEFDKLYILTTGAFAESSETDFLDFMVQKIQPLLPLSNLGYTERKSFIIVFEIFHKYLKFVPIEIVARIAENMNYLDEWSLIGRLNKIIPEGVESFKEDSLLFEKTLQRTIDYEVKSQAGVALYDINILEKVALELNLVIENELNYLNSNVKIPSKFDGGPLFPAEFENSEKVYTKEEEKMEIIRIFDKLVDIGN